MILSQRVRDRKDRHQHCILHILSGTPLHTVSRLCNTDIPMNLKHVPGGNNFPARYNQYTQTVIAAYVQCCSYGHLAVCERLTLSLTILCVIIHDNTGDLSCDDVVRLDRCAASWVRATGLCQRSCGRCGGGRAIGECHDFSPSGKTFCSSCTQIKRERERDLY